MYHFHAISVGERLKTLRKKAGYTQPELAEKMGMSHGQISKIESGTSSNITTTTLLSYMNIFNVSADFILTGKVHSDTMLNEELLNLLEKYQCLPIQDQMKIKYFIEIASLSPNSTNNNINYIRSNKTYLSSPSPIPILGYVAAGSPIIAYENPLSFINTYNRLVSYALYAKGNSMEPVIYDGEIIEIEKTDTLENGDIGIIQIDEEVTCKKFYRYSDRIELVSFNSDFKPIQIFKKDLKNVQILGKVVLNDVQNRRL